MRPPYEDRANSLVAAASVIAVSLYGNGRWVLIENHLIKISEANPD
jgi:hypothetical protein